MPVLVAVSNVAAWADAVLSIARDGNDREEKAHARYSSRYSRNELIHSIRVSHWGSGEPPRTRTWNPLIKSQLLYRLS